MGADGGLYVVPLPDKWNKDVSIDSLKEFMEYFKWSDQTINKYGYKGEKNYFSVTEDRKNSNCVFFVGGTDVYEKYCRIEDTYEIEQKWYDSTYKGKYIIANKDENQILEWLIACGQYEDGEFDCDYRCYFSDPRHWFRSLEFNVKDCVETVELCKDIQRMKKVAKYCSNVAQYVETWT